MYQSKHSQQGFSLFFVMILMLVIAFLVIVTSQSSVTEMRMSTNEADRKFALSLAENGLRTAEQNILEMESTGTTVTFKDDCTAGLCLPAKGSYPNTQESAPFKLDTNSTSTYPAWQRCAANTANDPTSCAGKTVIDEGCIAANKCKQSADNKSFYVIEYLGSGTNAKTSMAFDHFRITSRAHGNNDDTVVTLQTYVELTR